MEPNALRLELIEAVCRMPPAQLRQTAEYIRGISTAGTASAVPPDQSLALPNLSWPHAPLHRLSASGTYIVTTGTYQKAHFFRDPERLNLLESTLLSLAPKYDCQLEAWAVFSNHYHFVAHTLSAPSRLREFVTELHANTARELNRMDGKQGRKVWHNYWDTQLTFEKSYLARLNYVHQNAVRHGLVPVANQYRWCSAAWFERVARPAQVKTIYSFKIDNLRVVDPFEPLIVV
jgi:putative transposase